MTNRRDAIEREIHARCNAAHQGMPRCRVAVRAQRQVLLRTLIALLQQLGST